MTNQQIMAVQYIAASIIDAVSQADAMGAPGGVLYAAIMDKLTLDQFNQITGALISKQLLTRTGERYRATAAGRAWSQKTIAALTVKA